LTCSVQNRKTSSNVHCHACTRRQHGPGGGANFQRDRPEGPGPELAASTQRALRASNSRRQTPTPRHAARTQESTSARMHPTGNQAPDKTHATLPLTPNKITVTTECLITQAKIALQTQDERIDVTHHNHMRTQAWVQTHRHVRTHTRTSIHTYIPLRLHALWGQRRKRHHHAERAASDEHDD